MMKTKSHQKNQAEPKQTPMGRSVSEPPGRIGRRTFLARSAGIAGAAAAGFTATAARTAEEAPAGLPKWMLSPGTPMRGYGQPSRFEAPVKRFVAQPYGAIAPGVGPSFTPLESLNGTITPSGLHFERHHNGVPDINRSEHRLMIHGMVRRRSRRRSPVA